MKIFHSPNHTLHAPQWYIADGTARPCPETPDRAAAILHALRNAGHEPLETTIDPMPAIHRPSTIPLHLSNLHVQRHCIATQNGLRDGASHARNLPRLKACGTA